MPKKRKGGVGVGIGVVGRQQTTAADWVNDLLGGGTSSQAAPICWPTPIDDPSCRAFPSHFVWGWKCSPTENRAGALPLSRPLPNVYLIPKSGSVGSP